MKKKVVLAVLIAVLLCTILVALVGSVSAEITIKDVKQLTTDQADDQYPEWTPDGRITFNSKHNDNLELWIMNADGSNKQRLIAVPYVNGSASYNSPVETIYQQENPDGTKFVTEWCENDTCDIVIMDSSCMDIFKRMKCYKQWLTTNPAYDLDPAWSPDGKKIAFWSDRSENDDIWIMNIDGSSKLRLTTNPAYDRYPVWSPNGKMIAFESNRSGNSDIWVMTLEEDTGSVFVSSTPSGASIYLDGIYKGTTPKTITEVSVGTHTIRLEKSGYDEVSKTISVTAGDTTYVSETLPDTTPPSLSINPLPSSVSLDSITVSGIASDPSGIQSVTVNGEYAGTTSWSKSVSLSLGSNTITIVATDKSGNTETMTKMITYVVPTPTQTATISSTTSGYILQWPASSSASSEYSTVRWSANQATGEPNTFSCGDIDTAWAPKLENMGIHWIELGYYTAVYATEVRVHETYNSGAVVKVDLIDTNGVHHIVWTGSDTTACPGWLNISFAKTSYLVNKVKVYLDTDIVNGWNEIDTVQLIGILGVGSIYISTTPSSASIYLDGIYKGTTPKILSEVSVGTHTIKLKKSGYEDYTETVRVSASKTVSLSKTLTLISTPIAAVTPVLGSISVYSNPSGASIYLDGIYKGTTPKILSEVSVGTHTITLKKSGYEDYTETVRVSAGKTVSVSKTLTLIPTPTATMTPAFGYISVFSRPFGASIYVDGNYKGTTPEITTDASIESNIIKVSVGIHTIKLKKSGYEDYTETVSVSAGETVSIYKKLVSIATPPSTTTATSSEIPTITIFTKIPIEYLIGIAIIILIIGLALSRKGKQKPTSSQQKVVKYSAATLNLKSAYEYKGAKILYKIKVENSTKEPVSDIKIHLFVPEVFILKEKEKTIALLKPKESKTVTFEIRPTKECGECEISGRATYYDYASKKEKEIYLEPKTLSIICPMLKEKEIDAATWKNIIIGLKKAEETTKEIPIAAKLLFEIISDLLKEMNLFRLEPTITSSEQLFRATAKFYGEGVKGLKYACSIEVIGGHKKSKLIIKAWAEKEEALIGFYYGILDEMEKRVKVKSYIEDSIVQYYLTQTTIQDSVVIRSQIGIEKKKCPKCGNEVQAGDKFCGKCGFKLR